MARRAASRRPWLADKKLWPGWAYHRSMHRYCFACIAVAKAELTCTFCPLQWTEWDGSLVRCCFTNTLIGSLFDYYLELTFRIPREVEQSRRLELGQQLSEVATKIANLQLSPIFLGLLQKDKARLI